MENTLHKTERAWIELNMENLRHNAVTLQNLMPPECKLMAVVKTQAYGHGAVQISQCLNKAGVQSFAVATIEEGICLREHGVCGEILILGYTDVCRAPDLKKYDLIQTLIGFEYAGELNRQGISVKAHIKIDTGMHRLGMDVHAVMDIQKVFQMENIIVCGMFTHLCCCDSNQPEDVAFTEGQIHSFYSLTDSLKKSGITVPKLHIQSSYGLLNYPHLHCDYVRAGIALYGVLSSPENHTKIKPDLRPVLSLKSRVILIRSVAKGESIGYGRSFITVRDSRIGILPVGYGDGFPRSLSGKCSVMINGQVYPVVGRICMDSLAVDLTGADHVKTGDTATLVYAKGHDGLDAAVIAENTGSITNELLCRLGARLPVVVKKYNSTMVFFGEIFQKNLLANSDLH